tara:strand:+ start:800 stop:1159 length:360 start_codon:yes stop_codon:yes gene_type:complete
MAIKSNVAFAELADHVEDTGVTAAAVLDVFRGTGNVTMFQVVNGSAAAWFSIFDSKTVVLTTAASTTDAVLEIAVPASSTLICRCDIEFDTAVSYAATSAAGGSSNPSQTVALKILGEP